jgi:FkbM family methyltransferase
MKLENFLYRRTGAEKFATESKKAAYKELTKSTPKFFFLAGDNLPIEPLVTGEYEPHIRDLIDYAAACGNSDFLIDIGANIGLTSCQSGRHFKELHLFEPNPICAAILELNMQIALKGYSYNIYQYGLGESDREATLKVPLGNMGGAFINDKINSYSAEILAMKDNLEAVDTSNYEEECIHIRSAEVALGKLFERLAENNRCAGVVKIDVEGYEPVILQALTRIPPTFDLVIIFESWDAGYDFKGLLSAFGPRAAGYRLKSQRSYQNIFHRLLKKISQRHPADDNYQLTPFSGEDAAGDLVIKLARVA